MIKIILSLLVLSGISLGAYAQEKSSREKKGDKHFFIYAYDDAINQYARTKHITVSGQRNLAASYRFMKANQKSEATYALLISRADGLVPEDFYNYAMVLKASGKYEESNTYMRKFAEQKPYDLRAKSFQNNEGQLNEIQNDNGNFTIRTMSINTPSQDFGTAYFNDKIVYASSNAAPKMVKRLYNWNNEPFLNLYVAEVKDGQLKNREFFDKKDNGKKHDGPASFSKDGTFMAFTKNATAAQSKNRVVELHIYTRRFENGEWTEPLAFNYNSSDYSVGLPSLSADGMTMYFVSDMLGGYGGTDLYRSTRNSDYTWSSPVNLGNTINTEGNEMFPFFDESKMTLHFASDGHYGLGGYDIFSSTLTGSSWGEVINAGAPLNTRYDDFALIINGESTKGYFSSNRAEGIGSDDIYGVDIHLTKSTQITLEGLALDAYDNSLKGTIVSLFDEDAKEIGKETADENGGFIFSVEANKNYRLTGNKKDYLAGEKFTNTFNAEKVVFANVILLKDGEGKDAEDDEHVELTDDKVIVNEDLGPVIKMKTIYFDFDKSAITTKAAKELDKLVAVMNKFSKMEVALTSHTDCRGSEAYNNALSQARAKSSVEYIQGRITEPSRITGKGHGEDNLVNDCACEGDVVSTCSEQAHQLNRRTEFIVTKK
jgi:outer membrane protein OmpA-like peptidoglycan-associated protein